MENTLTPRTNTQLFGHEEAGVEFATLLASGRIPHAWILAGPKGIGKATLSYRVAEKALTLALSQREREQAIRRIIAGSHADLLVIEPGYDAKKEEAKREITVDEVRKLGEFLSLTPAESDWRVVIVDSADQLNPNAANAILKLLEEPPPRSLLLLVAHNPGKLLPTIRSRCRMLKLQPLSAENYRRMMMLLLPEAGNEEINALGILSRHSPGLAFSLHAADALSLYGDIVALMMRYPALDRAALQQFVDTIAKGHSHERWQVFSHLMLVFLSRAAKGEEGAEIIPHEAKTLARLRAHGSGKDWTRIWFAAAEQFSVAIAAHLDYKTVMLTFFESLATRRAA